MRRTQLPWFVLSRTEIGGAVVFGELKGCTSIEFRNYYISLTAFNIDL